MPRQIDKYVVYNLRETYHEVGEYEFKVVLNPKYFKNSHMSEVTIIDSDRKPIKFILKKWGRKINCTFTIDQNVPDGVSHVELIMKDDHDNVTNEYFRFWVIK